MYANDLRRGNFVRSRIHLGKLTSAPTVDGLVEVQISQTAESKSVLIPLPGFSVNRQNSAWSRFAPQAGDYCWVGYTITNQPVILSFTAWGTSSDGKQDIDTGGVRRVNNIADEDRTKSAGDSTTNGTKRIRKLAPGEFDMHSSGGADIYGNKDGLLRLSGGSTSLSLNKSQSCLKASSSAYDLSARGSRIRFGEVRRVATALSVRATVPAAATTGSAVLGVVPPVPPGGREHRVTVAAETLVPGVSVPLTENVSGDVISSAGVTELSGFTLPLREQKTIYGPTGLPVLTVETDLAGNVEADTLAGTFRTSAARQVHEGTVTASLTSSKPVRSVYLGSEGGLDSRTGTMLGGEAYVLGSSWELQRVILHQTMVTQLGAMATSLGAGATAAALLSLPPGAGAALAAALTATASAATAMAAAISTFEAAAPPNAARIPSYVSQKVFGDG